MLSKRLCNKKLKILFVASEAAPYAKVGGLGEVMYSLPAALRSLGHDARVILPKYASFDTSKYDLKMELFGLHVTDKTKDPNGLLVSNVLRHENSAGKTIAYFIENQEYYEKRANVYGYGDDTVRWVLLSKVALEFIRSSRWVPDLIVASDWQTGFVPNLMRTEYKNDQILSKIPVVFSIHNLKYQGLFNQRFVPEMDFDAGQAAIPDFFDPRILKMNGMRRGIMYADVITTVSKTYAKEILTEETGETLDKLLNERKARLFGVLNGIDETTYNPKTDSALVANYTSAKIKNRILNKIPLQKKFGLPENKDKFIISSVGRLTKQKGLDLVAKVMDSLLANIDFQFIIVGDGDSEFRDYFQNLQKKYPDRVSGHFFFDATLPRLIFAGSDTILLPSKFEPSGLVQMEAMRYGCVPIVRKVGGLADSVADFRPDKKNGTGFVFENYDEFSLLTSIIRAYDAYQYKKEWEALIKRSMTCDFSWKKSAMEYQDVFRVALNRRRESAG